MAKQLKPGQVCTIGNHVFRCKKATTEYTCDDCREANRIGSRETNGIGKCVLRQKTPIKLKTNLTSYFMCLDIFGLNNYPVLVK